MYAYTIMKNTTITNHPFMLVIYGPTGVGKTDLALAIAAQTPAEIINMDVGQFYTPLSIGTAKPDWQHSSIAHHLFDIIDTPINYTVTEYRTLLYKTVKEVLARGNLPILVGGSGFYLHSLLFAQPSHSFSDGKKDINIMSFYAPNADLWQELYKIDPARALGINKADTYRIERALTIWHATGKLPSSYAPVYHPEADYLIIFVERDRKELYQRINERVLEMLKYGWIAEAQALMGTAWEQFIRHKNLIGYAEIFDYLESDKTDKDFAVMIDAISTQTRQYAKRQHTFWRKLEREIKKERQYTGKSIGCLESINLTNIMIDLYINELLKRLSLR